MIFTVKNNGYQTPEQLRTNTLLNAYTTIKYYPMHATENVIDNYLQQHYQMALKDMCIKLLLSLDFHKDRENNLVLVFKEPKYDSIARLITYGDGIFLGSRILKTALNN